MTRMLTCEELVELVTDYLEGALPPEEQLRFEEHLPACDGCRAYMDQMQTMLRLTGRLNTDELDAVMVDRLLMAFRDWT
jgi:predicted anti-sigma-YlaC factor YlaD